MAPSVKVRRDSKYVIFYVVFVTYSICCLHGIFCLALIAYSVRLYGIMLIIRSYSVIVIAMIEL